MKANPKIKRVRLKINHESNFTFLGIVSPEPDYKLSLTINRKLKINLRSVPPVIVSQKAGEDISFSRFSDNTPSPHMTYELFSNRSGKDYLIKKLINVDFIFRVSDAENEIDINLIISLLKEIECITAVFNLDPGSIKDRNFDNLKY
jgi:hypothetical protein